VACGDIAAGFFMWSLRDAAAGAGYYTSPQAASQFFGQIADEISLACARGALACNPPLIAEMPHVTHEELAQIPQLYSYALKLLLLRDPSPAIEPDRSSGGAAAFNGNLQFLNYPLHTSSSDIRPGFFLSGWFYRSGNDWFSARVARQGTEAAVEFRRRESSDI